MTATGIGYAGIDGAWWLPATAPFVLPASVGEELQKIGAAVFAFLDTLADLYDTDDQVRSLLTQGIPPDIPRLAEGGPVMMARPDFQLVPEGNSYRLVATEIEICPAAQGFTHAMQVGYGLEADLVDHLARLLNGRPLLIVGTAQWSEFLFEQLALCRALAERGAEGYVLFDRAIVEIAADVTAGRRWTPPMFGIPARPASWNGDVLGRVRAAGLERFLWQSRAWPDTLGDIVVFRFGYFDCFGPEAIQTFVRWQAGGATFLNPPITYLESKSVLAAARLPVVHERLAAIDPALPNTLHRCLPETYLLSSDTLAMVRDNREEWIIKYAGFDGGNRAWGGRSVRFGRDHSAESWEVTLRDAVALPWPVVAQRLTPSAQLDIDYFDGRDRVRTLSDGTTRLRSFLLRDQRQRSHAVGSHLTVSAGDLVSEAADSVQTPVRFTNRS
jgi:hypothetical protein